MTIRLRKIEAHREHFRRFDNSLDMLCYRRRFPAIAVRGLGDRFRQMSAARRYFSLGLVAWITFGVFWYVSRYLFAFYLCVGGVPTPPQGLDYQLLNYRICAEDLDAVRNGEILVDDEGQTVLDPHLDFIMIISLQSDGKAEIARKVQECCFERGSVWPRRAIVLIDHGPKTSYQEVIDVVDQLGALEHKQICKSPEYQFINRKEALANVDSD